jgi:dUTP pyrophosphatase
MRMKDGVILLQYRNPKAQKLTKGHEGDAGWDLYCTEDRIIWPKSAIDLDTGWNINVPRGTWGLITARSSTFKRRRLIVQDGVIDSGYTGPLTILVWNPGFLPKKIRAGERLAQLIIVPLPETVIQLTDKMPETSRGKQCFGSTGN